MDIDHLFLNVEVTAVLREFDDLEADVIFSESFPADELGQAIMNRLNKAAGYQIIQA